MPACCLYPGCTIPWRGRDGTYLRRSASWRCAALFPHHPTQTGVASTGWLSRLPRGAVSVATTTVAYLQTANTNVRCPSARALAREEIRARRRQRRARRLVLLLTWFILLADITVALWTVVVPARGSQQRFTQHSYRACCHRDSTAFAAVSHSPFGRLCAYGAAFALTLTLPRPVTYASRRRSPAYALNI